MRELVIKAAVVPARVRPVRALGKPLDQDVKTRIDGLEAACDDWEVVLHFVAAMVWRMTGDANSCPDKLESYEDITEAHGAHFAIKCRAIYDNLLAPQPARAEIPFPDLILGDFEGGKIDTAVLKLMLPRGEEAVRLAGRLHKWAGNRTVLVTPVRKRLLACCAYLRSNGVSRC